MDRTLRIVPHLLTALALSACGSLPIAPDVLLSPELATTTDDLVVSVSSAEEGVSFNIAWYADGVEVVELADQTQVPASRTAKNEQWRVVATPKDDKDRFGDPGEATLVIVNTPATASVSVEPSEPSTTDDLVANASARDVDGDQTTLRYLWLRDGEQTEQTQATLSSDLTGKDEVWTVRVWADDGEQEGEPAEAVVSIDNAKPVADDVTLAPSEAFEGSTLTATARGQDTDLDELTWSYRWFVDDAMLPDESGDTIDGASFDKGQQVRVEATANDGIEDSNTVVSESVRILNSPPTSTGATLGPDPAYATSPLLCAGEGFADLDGDKADWRYGWTVDGKGSSESGATLRGSFARGQDVVCTAAPWDGEQAGEARASNTVRVQNSPPSISKVTLSSKAPKEADVLSVVVDGMSDADGDKVELRYGWYVDSKLVWSGATLSGGDFDKGQDIYVVVTPHDGTDAGAAIKSAVVTVANTAPVASSVTLSPTSPKTDDKVLAATKTVDADGDKVTLTYAWYVDGSKVSETSGVLDGASFFAKGDAVHVIITPHDGTDRGSSLKSATVTAVNTPPSLTSANLTPKAPKEADTLRCNPVGWSDADKDKEGYRYRWLRDTKVISGQTKSTLTGSYFSKGDTIRCGITPWDGDDTGARRDSAPTKIVNSPPSVRSVSIAPASPKEGTTLIPSISGASDPDGDRVTFKYQWFVAGKMVSTSSSLTSGSFDKNQDIFLRVTPNDGSMDGAVAKSNTVRSVNTAPTLSRVSLSPNPAYTSTPVTAGHSATDVDRDALTYSYVWYVDGTKQSTTSATLPSAKFNKKQKVKVTVTATDGEASHSLTSADRIISNSAPGTSGTPSITPGSPRTADNLACSTAGTTDADKDSLTYYYAWYRDSSLLGTYATTAKVHTLSSTLTKPGQVFTCRVRARDTDGAYGAWSASSPAVTISGPAKTWVWTDTTRDDVTSSSLYTVFKSLSPRGTDYIFFEVDGGSNTTRDGAWCSTRADFYVSNYISKAPTSGSATSGTWDKWHRGIGGSWVKSTAGRSNIFGKSCDSTAYSWCSAWGHGGRYLAVMPGQVGAQGESYASGWSYGKNYKVSVRVASTRKDACGF